MTGSLPEYARVVVAAAPDDEGAQAVARDLRDAGVEVVWSGLGSSAAALVATVLQEDPIALVVPGGGPATGRAIRAALVQAGVDDVPVITGDGTPEDVVDRLRETLGGGP